MSWESTPGSWQMHGNNLIAKHWLLNPLEKIQFVQTQPQLLSQLCWWETCPTDWAVNFPYTIVSVTREILAYVRCRIFWVNWSIFHQHKTECGWFYSKKNLGNTKSSIIKENPRFAIWRKWQTQGIYVYWS